MTKAGWKDYRCEGCRGEFTRRAITLPKLCFHCAWMASDAKKLRDAEERVKREATLYQLNP